MSVSYLSKSLGSFASNTLKLLAGLGLILAVACGSEAPPAPTSSSQGPLPRRLRP